MPADKRLIECPSCYATKGQYHKPGCPALTPPAGPATACLCGSPYADWTANGKLMCARCAANFVAASRFSADPAAVPPPEWAVEMANTVGDCGSHHDSDGACCVEIVNRIARLLASVREGALREAAAKCRSEAREWERTVGTDNGAREVVCDDLSDAILSLLHTPPSGGA